MAQDAEQSRWFAEEVQPHEGSLRSYLRIKFPAHPDIDDLVQETYAKLLEARSLNAVRSPKSFLFATARNAALDFFRRRKVVAIDATEKLESLAVIEEGPGVAELACRNQERQLLLEAIQSLPPRCRQVLTLRKIFGCSHQEIAQKLGISEHTVNAQIAMGVLRLRTLLEARGMTKGGSL